MQGAGSTSSRGLSAFDIYAALSDSSPADWPKPLADAFAELRQLAIAKGGRITYLELKQLEGRLSGNLGSTDLFDRLYAFAGTMFMQQHGRPFRPTEVVPAMEAYFADPRVALTLEELTPKWAAKMYAKLIVSHAKPADLAAIPTEADGGFAQREAFLERFRDFEAPYKKKIDALHSELERTPERSEKWWSIRRELREALWESHFATQAMLAQGADLSLAATSAGDDAKQVFDLLSLRTINATGANPTTSERRMKELNGDGESIKVQAAIDQQTELGELPVMREVIQFLKSEGRLHPKLLENVEVGLKGHVTPSMLQMVELLEREAGLKHLHVDGKGVSTVPLTGSTVQLWAKTYQPGYGDSLLTEKEHASMLEEQVAHWHQRAGDGARPLLIIGDGYEAARAANEAALRLGRRAAYVATTQSDLNYLEKCGELGVDVGTLAGTALKDVVTSRMVSDWIANHELAWIKETKRKPIDKATIVVVGGGNIGGALRDVLKERGAKNVIVADTDPLKGDVLRDPSGVLPPADYYFSCVGLPRAIGADGLRGMRDASVIFNCASRRELDEDWLLSVLRKENKEAIAHVVEKEILPEHGTLAVSFRGKNARTIYVRRMAQPAFDGIKDKSSMMMDVVRAGLVATTVETIERFISGSTTNEITPLSKRMQQIILDAIEKHYGLDMSKARATLAKAA